MTTQVYFPQTVFPVRVQATEYAELVLQIPEGSLSTTKEIDSFLARCHNADAVEYDGPLPKFFDPATGIVALLPTEDTEPIPFYRVLSERGFVRETRSFSKETAVEMLRAEGHEVVEAGKGKYRVEGYREKLFDLRGGVVVEGVVE